MRTSTIKSFFLLRALILVFLGGCKKDDMSGEEITIGKGDIFACGVKNPKWLKKEISLRTNKGVSSLVPVKVSVYKSSFKEIICIQDLTSSMMSMNYCFFDCKGNQIEFRSKEYNYCFQLFKDGAFSVVWEN